MFVFIIVTKGDLDALDLVEVRSRIGSLYHDLDARERSKLINGAMFFLQRCLLLIIMAS